MNMAAAIDIAIVCPVCAGPSHCVYRDLYDDRYGYPDAFTLYACEHCGHMHIPTRFQPEDLGRLYTNYYPRGNFDVESFQPERETHGFMAWLRGDLASAFRRVPRDVRVLDIGCGIGATLAYHKARGCEAVGMEADKNVQAIAARHGLDIRQGIFDGTQFDSEYFDYVTLDQVAEHVTDPLALMRGIARVLKPGGKVVITTPNARSLGARIFGRKWLNWHVPYHIQFYTRRSLEIVAREAGLEVVKHVTVTATVWQLYQWYHAMAFPVRGKRHAFWTEGLVRGGRPRRAFVGLMKELDIHVWMARILDLLGLGDNHVFVLRKP